MNAEPRQMGKRLLHTSRDSGSVNSPRLRPGQLDDDVFPDNNSDSDTLYRGSVHLKIWERLCTRLSSQTSVIANSWKQT